MESFRGKLSNDKKIRKNDGHSNESSLSLIRDIVRNYFQTPWFDLTEKDEQLIRDFIIDSSKQISNSGKKSTKKSSLLVQLTNDDNKNDDDGRMYLKRFEPKFEIVSLDDIRSRRKNSNNFKQKQQKSTDESNYRQSILFIRLADNQTDDECNQISNNTTHRSTVQIRLVTDDEAIKHLSEILKSCSISNDEIISAYNQLERFIDRDKVLQVKERTEFLRKLSEWSETLLEYSSSDDLLEKNLSSSQSSNDDDDDDETQPLGGSGNVIDDNDQEERQIGRELNRMAMKILTFKERQQLLANIVANIPLMFRDVSDLNMYRINLTETTQMLESESKQLFHRWSTNVSKNIHYDLTKQCIVIDEQTQRPRITLSQNLEKLATNVRKLRQYRFIIPDDIDRMESQISTYIDFVHDLRKIVRFYMNVAEQILPSQRPMLIDRARAFTTLLESRQQLKWSDGSDAISGWIDELKQFMSEFQKQNKHLQRLHQKILETIKWMIDASLSQWQHLIEKVRLIISEVSVNHSYQYTYVWRKHWDYQLYKILEYYFNQIIRMNRKQQQQQQQQQNSKQLNRIKTAKSIKSSSNDDNHHNEMIIMFMDQEFIQWKQHPMMNPIDNTIELQFNPSGYLVYEPSFEIIKKSLFERFQYFIRFPSIFHAFVDWSLDAQINPSSSSSSSMNGISGATTTTSAPRTLFHNIYYRNATNFTAIYHKVFDAIDELIRIREQFARWTAIYNLIKMIKSSNYNRMTHQQPTVIDDNGDGKSKMFSCKTLEDYQYNLELIRNLSLKFSNEYSMINEIHCENSIFVVNIIPIKMFIEWLFNETETVLLHTFRDQCQQEIDRIETICRQTIEQLKHCPININELIEFDQMIMEKLEPIYTRLNVDNVTLREKIHFFRSWSTLATPLTADIKELAQKFDQTKLIINEFENIYNNRMELLENYREQLQSKLSIELNTIDEEIDNFLNRWIQLNDQMRQTPEIINDFQINSNQLMMKMTELSTSCEYFHVQRPKSFEQIQQINVEIRELYEKFHILYEFEKGLSQYQEMEWIVSRNKLQKINQYINDWLEQHPSNDGYLQLYIERWQKFLNLIEICRGDNYQQLHWNQFIGQIIGHKNLSYENLKLSDLWIYQDKLRDCRTEILDINKRAYNDNLLRESLNDLNQFALDGHFILYPYRTKDDHEIMLIKDWYQCYNQISDCFLLIQTIRNMDNEEISNEYLDQYQEWEMKLVRFESLIILLNSIQRKWISLEPIYHDHRGSSSNGPSFFHDTTFIRYSNDFQELMKSIHRNSGRFVYLLQMKNDWENRLRTIDQNFTNTQKKLRTFIEESRQRFPRFYFLADEDLLLILSGKVDLNQSGLVKKLFVNTIGCLVYQNTHTQNNDYLIEAIESIQGERIRLRHSIQMDNNNGPSAIEKWLQNLDEQIKSTLKFIFMDKLSIKQTIYNDFDLFATLPSQILSLYCYIDFTESVEMAINKNHLIDLRKHYEQILSTMTKDGTEFHQKLFESLSTTNSNHSNSINENLSKIKIKQVVLDLIHYLNVIQSLIDADVKDQKHWLWQSQLRFYVINQQQQQQQSANIKICMGLASFDYSFEYLGCLGDSKLVSTTLTNKCFLTLTQAMDLGLGGNPYGPAGTGKTESVKALGQYFGRQVLVFNCDEAIDVKSMTRIIVGLLKCGNWGCFDEFNRLQLDVLSVLSSQIQEIQYAIKNESKTVNLNEYGHVAINNNAAIFITLNPAGKEYGGRNRIPDNLKSLFLPVAMTVPEIKTIVRFLSLAEGFSDMATKILGDKIPCWFEFAQGSMSQQKHYDWGLRTIKACLESSGRRLNQNRMAMKMDETSNSNEYQMEIALVIDTLRQQIKSKLVDTDALKFDGLIEAVFGSEYIVDFNSKQTQPIQMNSESNDLLVDIVEKCFNDNNLIHNEYQMEKILQLYEQIQTRFGVVLIGPSGSGKTTIWQMLRHSLEQLSKTSTMNKSSIIDVIIINPKSMPRSRLFGYIDDDTREWHDGLFSAKSREITRNNDDGGNDNNVSHTMNWIIFDGDIDPDWVEALNSVLDDNRVLTLPSGERIDFDLNHCRILFETTSLKNASPATISRLGVVSIDMIMINEMVQCFVAQNQLSFTAISIIQNYLNLNHQQLFLPISTARSLLKHLHYCQLNHEDESRAIDRISGHHHVGNIETMVANNTNLIITDSVRRYIEMLKPLIGQHICLIGPIGCGKTILAQELLFTSMMNGHLLIVDCTPTTNAETLLKLLMNTTTIVHSGTNRMLRAQNVQQQQIWLFIRHFELLSYDKWSSNSLVSLLTLMLKHNGFYHPETFEWITVDVTNFQLILSCTDVRLIDKRLLTRLHLIQFEHYSLEEIKEILHTKIQQSCTNINPNEHEYFASHYIDIIRQLYLNNNDDDGGEEKINNFLKIGINIIDSLNHYDCLNEKCIDYEIYRTLMNHLSQKSYRNLLKTLMNDGDHDNNNGNENRLYFTSLDGQQRYQQINYEQFQLQIQKWIRNYCQENDLNNNHQQEWPQLNHTLTLVADLCSFLAINNQCNGQSSSIPIMLIIGHNGNGRKFLIKTIAHNFGYDRIWTPDSIQSERHLRNELSALLSNDDNTAMDDDNNNQRRLLLLIDEIHLEILPYLRDQIYTQINSYNQQQQQQQQASNIMTIRLIMTTTRLTSMDHLMWLRKASQIHRSDSFTMDDYNSLTAGLIRPQIDKHIIDDESSFDSIIKMFYPIYQHFQQQQQQQQQDQKVIDLNTENIRSYTDFLQTFLQLFYYQSAKSNEENERMKLGVERLDQVSTQVKILKDEAMEQKKLLDNKRQEADDAFQLIMNSMHQSEDKKLELEDVQQRIRVETENLHERKSKIDEELSEIEPMLQAAKAAIGGIRSDSLSEIRSLRAPPEVIRDILEGVLRLMGVNDTSWASMKTFLSKRGVKEDIMNFDCHKITPEIRIKVEQLLRKRSESFQSTTAKRASAAAAPLAEWVKANVEYSSVLHKIEPLEMELKKLETNLHRAQTRIRTLDTQLHDVDTEVDTLRERMQAVTVEAAQIEINLKKSTKVLEQSESIVNDLSDEHQRWNEKLLQIEIERKQMPYKCMIAAAYLTQACRESSYQRRTEIFEQSFEKFHQINSFDLMEFLGFETEEEMLLFGSSLSSPSSSNSATMIRPMMIPLICDPAHKALNHFKNAEITNFNAKDWLKILELGIRFGRTVIITDFNQFDIRLVPLIMGTIHGSSDTRFWTFIGEKKVDYNPRFALYLMTNNLQSISPLTMANIRVVNLSPSFGSISSQLLGHIIDVKKPELETEKIRIDDRVRDLQKQLKQLENELLAKLSSKEGTGNILENSSLIEQLKFLKKSAAQVECSLKESDRLKSDLERERIQYKDLSQFAANLYFSMENLPKLCPMYYFGYGEFEQLFIDSLRAKSEFNEDDVCAAFYHYISRALFAEHRRTFRQFVKNCFPKQSTQLFITSDNNDINTQNIGEFLAEIFQQQQQQSSRMNAKIALIITMPGSDPNTEIKNSIEKLGYDLQMISMGNDTIDKVSSMIQMTQQSIISKSKQSQPQPKVLCLNNLHLVIGWLPKLFEILTNHKTTTATKPPLILVTESSEHFPRTLLEICIKFAHESAPGLRAHLRRLRSQSQRPKSNNHNQNDHDFDKLYELLEYFHAICCERRFYIPFGWNKNYEFGFNEFHFGHNIIDKMIVEMTKKTSLSSAKKESMKNQKFKIYQYLEGLFHQVIYGGKIDFNIDEIVLGILIRKCFHPNMDQSLMSSSTNDFKMLGLPSNANDFRDRLLEKRLKQNLQLLSITTSSSLPAIKQQEEQQSESSTESKQKTLSLNPSGIRYFRKLWLRILGKCRIDQIDDLREEMANNIVVESSFLDAPTIDLFIRQFVLFEFDFAKRLILQIDRELHSEPIAVNLDSCIQINHTPESWLNVWLNGSEIAQDFLINLARIYMKLSTIITMNGDEHQSSDTFGATFDMTHCFHPKLFLNSLKQFVAKKLSTSIDCLSIQYHWNDDDENDTDQQRQRQNQIMIIKLDGIWIEAAQFQNGQLRECQSDSPFTSLMPSLLMIFSKSKDNVIDNQSQSSSSSSSSSSSFSSNQQQRKTMIKIPLYSCSKRQTLLEQWQLPCSTTTKTTTATTTTQNSNERWLEMGVALVLGNFV
ncbi:cytoplasmic dynein 2 heavy chain 1-like [Dermatophagoides farinae]|uniref:cytoplasmic dynein 2 heavy chain 1-like n=1 Tax=Dermatophagoides farinae TaxID=6954 RepID=UPI003F600AE7